jgi:hypothetical protein
VDALTADKKEDYRPQQQYGGGYRNESRLSSTFQLEGSRGGGGGMYGSGREEYREDYYRGQRGGGGAGGGAGYDAIPRWQQQQAGGGMYGQMGYAGYGGGAGETYSITSCVHSICLTIQH